MNCVPFTTTFVQYVRWNGVYSKFFNLACSVRHDGVLSHMLFAIFCVDDIMTNLKDCQEGCHVGDLYLTCAMYADDRVQLSSSLNVFFFLLL